MSVTPPRGHRAIPTATDGDLVWLHFKYTMKGKEFVMNEIFRVADGTIVERGAKGRPVQDGQLTLSRKSVDFQ